MASQQLWAPYELRLVPQLQYWIVHPQRSVHKFFSELSDRDWVEEGRKQRYRTASFPDLSTIEEVVIAARTFIAYKIYGLISLFLY